MAVVVPLGDLEETVSVGGRRCRGGCVSPRRASQKVTDGQGSDRSRQGESKPVGGEVGGVGGEVGKRAWRGEGACARFH